MVVTLLKPGGKICDSSVNVGRKILGIWCRAAGEFGQALMRAIDVLCGDLR